VIGVVPRLVLDGVVDDQRPALFPMQNLMRYANANPLVRLRNDQPKMQAQHPVVGPAMRRQETPGLEDRKHRADEVRHVLQQTPGLRALRDRCLVAETVADEWRGAPAAVLRERQIVAARVPGATEELTDQVARIVRSIRALELKKAPSVSETLDWARTLVVLGVETIDAEMAHKTLNVLLKYKTDLDRVSKELDLAAATRPDS